MKLKTSTLAVAAFVGALLAAPVALAQSANKDILLLKWAIPSIPTAPLTTPLDDIGLVEAVDHFKGDGFLNMAVAPPTTSTALMKARPWAWMPI